MQTLLYGIFRNCCPLWAMSISVMLCTCKIIREKWVLIWVMWVIQNVWKCLQLKFEGFRIETLQMILINYWSWGRVSTSKGLRIFSGGASGSLKGHGPEISKPVIILFVAKLIIMALHILYIACSSQTQTANSITGHTSMFQNKKNLYHSALFNCTLIQNGVKQILLF